MKQIGIRLSPDILRKVDRMRGTRSRSEFIREAIDQSINSINGYIKSNPDILKKVDKALKDVGL